MGRPLFVGTARRQFFGGRAGPTPPGSGCGAGRAGVVGTGTTESLAGVVGMTMTGAGAFGALVRAGLPGSASGGSPVWGPTGLAVDAPSDGTSAGGPRAGRVV